MVAGSSAQGEGGRNPTRSGADERGGLLERAGGQRFRHGRLAVREDAAQVPGPAQGPGLLQGTARA